MFLILGSLLAATVLSVSTGGIVPLSLEAGQRTILARIEGPKESPVRRTIILSAAQSRIPGAGAQYIWHVHGIADPISRKLDAIYTPEKDGELQFRLIVRSTVDGKPQQSQALHTVRVYRRKIVIIADAAVPPRLLFQHIETASRQGTYVKVLQADTPLLSPGGEGALSTLLSQSSDTLFDAEAIVLFADSLPGLQSLLKIAESDDRIAASLQRQSIILLTELPFSAIARGASGILAALRPERSALLRPSALSLLMQTDSVASFLQKAFEGNAEMLLIDPAEETPPWALLTRLVSAMLVRGVSSQTVILLLLLPVIATVLAFLKQVIGITTYGLFTPSIIALSFLALGWWVGLLFLLFVLVTGYATRAAMGTLRLLYIPKVAIILTAGSVLLLLLLGIGTFFDILLSRDSVFILLILSTLSESFLATKSEQGWLSAVFVIGQTVGAALLCIFIVQSATFQSFVLAYPESILLTVLFNVLLGRYTGLRLTEYFRFREVFRHLEEN